ncbi:MAG TPA: sigma-54 dependent transcriptional regulator [bacterium]|jgi:two-component system response regulator HydG|nr:sigma-54 dependent transcriptional regulator [bacterium]
MELKPKILVVEDDPAGGRMLRALFQSENCEVLLAPDGARALELVGSEPGLDVAFLDLGLPDLPGMQVLESIKKTRNELPVIILSGDTEIPSAVQAIQLGATNYFIKPINTGQVLAALRQILERKALLGQVQDLKLRLDGLARLMGPSATVRDLQEKLKQVAGSPLTVLLHGETGAGKEVLARAVHDFSPRSAKPFIALDCGAIPENLLESELFGHEKGAFSGAERKKEGQFLLAQGGTLFLDEIANLPLGLQAKLLRVLQERELQPLGSTRRVSLDVRFVAASNHDLEKEVESGRFRQDLFFRLAEFRIAVPPLRERLDDLPYLAQRFLEEAGVEFRRPVRGISAEALQALKTHAWPGNVRELRNVIRQGALLAQGGALELEDLAPLLKKTPSRARPVKAALSRAGMTLKQAGMEGLAESERTAILDALAESRGNILKASRALKTDNKTLHGKLKKYGIRAKDFEPGD